jgi:hypothetical protein
MSHYFMNADHYYASLAVLSFANGGHRLAALDQSIWLMSSVYPYITCGLCVA